MSNPIKASPTTNRSLESQKELTASAASGSKWALDVNVVNSDASQSPVDKGRYDYSGGTVSTVAYTQLIAATAATASQLEIFDSSGQTLVLAIGAALAEVDQLYIIPGGNGRIPIQIPSGSRLSIKAVSANATVGECTVNLYG